MSKTPWLIKLVRPTYGKWLLHHWGVKCEGYEKIPQKGTVSRYWESYPHLRCYVFIGFYFFPYSLGNGSLFV